MRGLNRELGNVGVHLDATTLARQPPLLGHTRNHGLKLMTYHGTSDARHADLVSEVIRATAMAPDALIIDGDPDSMCARLRQGGL